MYIQLCKPDTVLFNVRLSLGLSYLRLLLLRNPNPPPILKSDAILLFHSGACRRCARVSRSRLKRWCVCRWEMRMMTSAHHRRRWTCPGQPDGGNVLRMCCWRQSSSRCGSRCRIRARPEVSGRG